MPVNNVSFGSVVAVSGKTGKVNRVNAYMHGHAQKGEVIMKDVTQKYVNSSSNGMIARAAQKGNKVEVYITGDDVEKIKNKESGWDTLGGILSNLNAYINLEKTSVSDAVNKILKS